VALIVSNSAVYRLEMYLFCMEFNVNLCMLSNSLYIKSGVVQPSSKKVPMELALRRAISYTPFKKSSSEQC